MKNFRCIYVIEAYTNTGELTMRRFARNKRTAERIRRQCKKGEPDIRKLHHGEREFVNIADVEG